MNVTAHWGIEQRTQEWHRIKWGFVGSSDASKILKYKRLDDVAFDIAAERMEDAPEYFDEGFISADMMRGIDMEPEAIGAVIAHAKQQSIDFDVEECGFIHRNDLPIGVSPDRISLDLTQAIEVKCPSAREHLKAIYNQELPYKYIGQAIQYFAVCDTLQVLWWGSYRPEQKTPLMCLRIDLDALINIGTEAKTVMVSMREAAELMRAKASEVWGDVQEIMNK